MKGYPIKKYNVRACRYCQTLELKKSPNLIKAYKELHKKENIWPETLEAIKKVGILEMEIYLLENQLFMIVDLPETLEWDIVMEAMSKMPKQKEWEEFVAQYQKASSEAKSSDKWRLMERIFHLYQ